jgi:FMN-dependent NADH-azoreductase
MYFSDDEDDDFDFDLSTQLNTLKENKNNQTIEIANIRTEKINKLRLEEENIKAIYEVKMRDVEERMFVLMNTSDEDLFNNEFHYALRIIFSFYIWNAKSG